MKTLFLLAMIFSLNTQDELMLNFGQTAESQQWYIVNDGVMGGKSQSQVTQLANSLVFSGEISLKNNGGFASLQSRKAEQDLSPFTQVNIKYRSTGQSFALRLLTHEAYYLPSFKHDFESTDGEWKTVNIPLESFNKYALGSATGESITQSDLRKIIRLGIIVSNKEEGPFSIEIDFIQFI